MKPDDRLALRNWAIASAGDRPILSERILLCLDALQEAEQGNNNDAVMLRIANALERIADFFIPSKEANEHPVQSD